MMHTVHAQERLSTLPSNPLLKNTTSNYSSKRQALSLPFADDFNQNSYFPDNSRWADNDVFINNNYPKSPPTIGVATFDGLNSSGEPYDSYNNSFGKADQLTSLPLDLSSYQESDNIYLSFYWQAGGFGELPESSRDYLIVEFLNTNQKWEQVLRINPTDTVNQFKQEFIKVRAEFLSDQFQFRWVAFGNLAGSTDHWHIDYILLDRNRNPEFESSVSDVAYSSGNGGYFKNYYQMPFKHFLPEYLKDTISVKVKNNFLNTVDIVDNFQVKNLSNGQIISTYNGPSIDIASRETLTYFYPALDLSSVTPTSDTTELEVRYYFQTSSENNSPAFVKANNELKEKITFANAFAYDDGSAERAYRLENYTEGKIAVKFHASVMDTLRAIRIHFPYFPNYTNTTDNPFFNVAVYKSLDSITGENDEVIYKELLVQKEDFNVPADEIFNGFAYYTFKPELNDGKDYLLVDGDFYLAIEHEKFNDVDLGFDLNQAHPTEMWYNVGYGWYSSQYPGSIMMNAIMGKALGGKYTSINENSNQNHSIPIYPNPTQNQLFISTDYQFSSRYQIFNLAGSQIISGQIQPNQSIDVNQLSQGMYILQLTGNDGKYIGQAKFIKQ
ncbi:MAG TPA: T9SS type A sorting domain-containing protein [Chitinophagales bacterium]|nr:T9SS type A sorting domain-containing protein [Chitinophagales bacterium]